MPASVRLLPLCALLSIAGCDGLDDEAAAAQIREQFCREWPHGCSDDLQVVIRDSQRRDTGRVLDFQLVAGEQATGTVSGAYFMKNADGWELVVFEDPFRARLEEHASRITAERSRLVDELLDLKVAQDWHRSIHRRYAPSLAELERVRYRPPDAGSLRMSVTEDGSGWTAEAAGEHVTCSLAAGEYIADCQVVGAALARGRAGPLTAVFGGD